MESKEKVQIISNFGLCIIEIIEENKIRAKENLKKGTKDHNAITSLRKLAASSGVEFSIIQKITSGKRNPALSTIISIAEGLNMKPSELFHVYESISASNISNKSKSKTKKNKK